MDVDKVKTVLTHLNKLNSVVDNDIVQKKTCMKNWTQKLMLIY